MQSPSGHDASTGRDRLRGNRLLGVACIVVLALAVWTPRSALGQSLADVARAEAARRKSITTPSKVYTTEDLPTISRSTDAPASEDTGSDEAAAADDASASPDGSAPESSSAELPGPAEMEGAPGGPGGRDDEAYWRDRVGRLRDDLDRAGVFRTALQSRADALMTDFVNRDDPAQRERLAAERQRALTEMERLEAEIERLTAAIEDAREDARRADVPADWVR